MPDRMPVPNLESASNPEPAHQMPGPDQCEWPESTPAPDIELARQSSQQSSQQPSQSQQPSVGQPSPSLSIDQELPLSSLVQTSPSLSIDVSPPSPSFIQGTISPGVDASLTCPPPMPLLGGFGMSRALQQHSL